MRSTSASTARQQRADEAESLKPMTISQVARAAGIPTTTLRYVEALQRCKNSKEGCAVMLELCAGATGGKKKRQPGRPRRVGTVPDARG